MESTAVDNNHANKKSKNAESSLAKPSFLSAFFEDYFFKPDISTTLTYFNFAFGYFVALVLLSGHDLGYWYVLIYLPLVYIIYSARFSKTEKDRLQIAHRMPYFADALANSLSVGSTLEQAFRQSAHYLKGKIKYEFDLLILKNILGKDLGDALLEVDSKFPNTGLRYLISLLKEYRELGVGISPLLKRISVALAAKEEAEEKIRTILSAGSGYARLAIGVFACIFVAISFLLKDQVVMLFSDQLKPYFLFLITWTGVGIFIVTRVTSIRFAKSFALRPSIVQFMKKKELSFEDLFYYSGVEWSKWMQQAVLYSPLLIGFIAAYLISGFTGDTFKILIAFAGGALVFRFVLKYILEGMVEDQLIQTIEIFPDMLQVFIIGLNSGLNTYQAFQFAQDAIKGTAPKVLSEELCRAKFAMECGEEHAKTWERLAEKLPFESVVDFCEIMVVAPIHGESIVNSIVHMTNSYQSKKLTIIEKKATTLGQVVIPVIVVAFFPLFLFAIFAPLITKLSVLFR